MRTFLVLIVTLLGFAGTADACNHVPAQALLQGVTCPTCGATAQSVVQQQAVQYVVQQPVQQVQRIVVQQPVVQQQQVQYVQQQLLQPQFIQGYSSQSLLLGGQNVIVAPTSGINLQFQRQGFFGHQHGFSIGGGFR